MVRRNGLYVKLIVYCIAQISVVFAMAFPFDSYPHMSTMVSSGFTFQGQELPQKLSLASHGIGPGYWRCQLVASAGVKRMTSWYLALSRGRVIFSGTQQLSWPALKQTLQRYVPRLRSDGAKQDILALEKKFPTARPEFWVVLLAEMHQQGLVSREEVAGALRLKILSDFDQHLFNSSGQAEFLPTPELSIHAPTLGFAVETLIAEAQKRQVLWRKLQTQIPSMEAIPILNTQAAEHSNFTVEQKRRLEGLVRSGKTLSSTASILAQDPLEVAKVFSKLISNGLVTLDLPVDRAVPEILIVDDSPLVLKQFERLVTSWGYRVKVSQTSVSAIPTMLLSNPAIVFLDINMPGVTGFDLVKKIRRHPKLAPIPLVMLTAEKTLSNNWRAQWSGCRFLTKPLAPNEVPDFQVELRMLLEELAPLNKKNQFEGRPIYRLESSST